MRTNGASGRADRAPPALGKPFEVGVAPDYPPFLLRYQIKKFCTKEMFLFAAINTYNPLLNLSVLREYICTVPVDMVVYRNGANIFTIRTAFRMCFAALLYTILDAGLFDTLTVMDTGL
jgi:hypothetical protein